MFFALLFMTVFTTAVMIICNNGGLIPDSLIYCVFSVLAIAVIMSGAITIKKFRIGEVEVDLKSKNDDTEGGDEDETD